MVAATEAPASSVTGKDKAAAPPITTVRATVTTSCSTRRSRTHISCSSNKNNSISEDSLAVAVVEEAEDGGAAEGTKTTSTNRHSIAPYMGLVAAVEEVEVVEEVEEGGELATAASIVVDTAAAGAMG